MLLFIQKRREKSRGGNCIDMDTIKNSVIKEKRLTRDYKKYNEALELSGSHY